MKIACNFPTSDFLGKWSRRLESYAQDLYLVQLPAWFDKIFLIVIQTTKKIWCRLLLLLKSMCLECMTNDLLQNVVNPKIPFSIVHFQLYSFMSIQINCKPSDSCNNCLTSIGDIMTPSTWLRLHWWTNMYIWLSCTTPIFHARVILTNSM